MSADKKEDLKGRINRLSKELKRKEKFAGEHERIRRSIAKKQRQLVRAKKAS